VHFRFFNGFNSSFQHQQQVLVAVERAKQITMAELNALMQVRKLTLMCALSMWYLLHSNDL
jgi:hypothetical protein